MVAAVGHTEATYDQTRAAIDAGATVGTHLFNAMRPIDRREPGPIIALLEDPRVTVELITDGVHVDPAIYRHVTRSAGPDRVSLVTDAMAATGMADGVYHLGPLAVDVVDGVARVAGTDTIAGSTATMDRVFRFAVTHSGLPLDEALMLAVRQASINPARALGLPAAGLVPGASADLVVLDSALAVTGVLRRGAWVVEPDDAPLCAVKLLGLAACSSTPSSRMSGWCDVAATHVTPRRPQRDARDWHPAMRRVSTAGFGSTESRGLGPYRRYHPPVTGQAPYSVTSLSLDEQVGWLIRSLEQFAEATGFGS